MPRARGRRQPSSSSATLFSLLLLPQEPARSGPWWGPSKVLNKKGAGSVAFLHPKKTQSMRAGPYGETFCLCLKLVSS